MRIAFQTGGNLFQSVPRWLKRTASKLAFARSSPTIHKGSDDMLAEFGDSRRVYRGSGNLSTDDGRLKCDFQACQLSNGEVVMVCQVIQKGAIYRITGMVVNELSGVTSDGDHFRSGGRHFQVRASTGVDVADTFAFKPDWICITAAGGSHPQAELMYDLVNCEFDGIQEHDGREWTRPLRLELRDTIGVFPVTLRRVSDYDVAARRLRTRDRVATTCTATISLKELSDSARSISAADRVITNLCALLSVARGTKVQWISRSKSLLDGTVIERCHNTNVVRPFGWMAPIDARSGKATKSFVENAYPVFLAREHSFRLLAMIDAYTSARSDTDFVEMRGAKLTVALEAIKQEFINGHDVSTGLLLGPEITGPITVDFIESIANQLRAYKVEEGIIGQIATKQNVINLFRRTFRDMLTTMADELGIELDAEELRWFVRSRNALIHNGKFWCSLEPPTPGSPRPKNSTEELLFDVYFLDRIMLAVCGHEGEYVDWRDLQGSSRATVVRRNAKTH